MNKGFLGLFGNILTIVSNYVSVSIRYSDCSLTYKSGVLYVASISSCKILIL